MNHFQVAALISLIRALIIIIHPRRKLPCPVASAHFRPPACPTFGWIQPSAVSLTHSLAFFVFLFLPQTIPPSTTHPRQLTATTNFLDSISRFLALPLRSD
ncbi:uncharacterized protein BO97DRAFT_136144 [Aspergillus homomorphus CBS 101889]|uniref:Uncharacterized protein n=1 Tax=Aspergillus homomorphus (strain CBS 101889) TaxID=1450537 RepID=A0A395IEB2_ASPHC|nr:hypothetical protein BO97DRAFT_136144 [Aspergillus homomorphus CBS 101889]RAL16504.1 hypothetical protein BO97DRAFT_136144 [Aspergillus homomorphus CBS 101889]